MKINILKEGQQVVVEFRPQNGTAFNKRYSGRLQNLFFSVQYNTATPDNSLIQISFGTDSDKIVFPALTSAGGLEVSGIGLLGYNDYFTAIAALLNI